MKTIVALLSLTGLLAVASSAQAAATTGTYRGLSTTHVYYYSFSLRKFTSVRTYSSTAVVSIGSPKTQGVQHENNPFSLVVSSAAPLAGGALTLDSASTGNFLLQYWKFSNTSSGFTGRLTNDGSDYGLNVMNAVNAWGDLVPGSPSLGGSITSFTFYDARYGAGYQTALTASNSGKKLSMQITGWERVLGEWEGWSMWSPRFPPPAS